MKAPTSEVARQIERRMRALNLNPFSLAKQAGMSRTAVYDILSGKSRHPRHDTLEKICGVLGCSLGQLMVADGATPPSRAAVGGDVRTAAVLEVDLRHVDGVALQVPANGASVLQEWHLPKDLLRLRTTADAQALRIIAVQGDSMAPDFRPGERVMVDLADRIPSPPGVFVVWDGFGFVLKRLEMVPYSAPARVRIVSSNRAYETHELPAESLSVNGRVIGKWHWV